MTPEQQNFEKRLAEFEKRFKKIERYMFWGTIFGALRFFLIATPIFLAILYVPPFLLKYIPILEKLMSALQHSH